MMLTVGRLLQKVWGRLSREPRRENGAWLAPLGAVLLLANVFFASWHSVESIFIIFAAGLSMIAVGVAESLPPRRRAIAVALRLATLPLIVVATVAFISELDS